MKNLKFFILSFMLTFAFSCGQQKSYVTYKIKKGETIQDIAKRLNIKTKDLLRLNPDIEVNSKKNTTIIIPSNSSNNIKKTSVDNSLEKEEIINDSILTNSNIQIISYKTHKVIKGETVWAITHKYNISKDELIILNPDVSTSLKNNELSIDQILKIKKIIKNISLKEDLKNFVTHIVKPKETIYSITRFYNISKEKLIELNNHLPNLKNNALNIGDILKIRPINKQMDSDLAKIYIDSIQSYKTINLSLLLPFNANEFNSLSAKEIFGKRKKSKLINLVTDMYLGVEMAIDSIKKQGVNVILNTFDTGKRGENIPKILSEEKLDSSDVIIGPLYFDKAKMVAKKVNIPVVYPYFSKYQNNFSSSNIITTAPNIFSYAYSLTSYLKNQYINETIFIIGDGKTDQNNSLVNTIYDDLKTNDSIKNIIILKPENGYIKKNRFTDNMKPNSNCWVIIASNDNVTVDNTLNSMIILPEKVTANIFAIKKGDIYEKFGNNKLANMGFTYVTSNFVDETDASTKLFNKKYKRKNYINPSKNAIKGFDICYDILMRLASGYKLNKTFKQGVSIRIGNKFSYHKKFFGPSSNNGLFIVKYNKDLSLKRLK